MRIKCPICGECHCSVCADYRELQRIKGTHQDGINIVTEMALEQEYNEHHRFKPVLT